MYTRWNNVRPFIPEFPTLGKRVDIFYGILTLRWFFVAPRKPLFNHSLQKKNKKTLQRLEADMLYMPRGGFRTVIISPEYKLITEQTLVDGYIHSLWLLIILSLSLVLL